MTDLRYWCPQCGSKNTQLIVTEIGKNGESLKSILSCHDCRSSMGFIELKLGYIYEKKI
jgi:transcriptional regulator NrdR family protein